MPVSVGGIIINVVMLLVVIILAMLAYYYYEQLKICTTQESQYCYTIICPNASSTATPCGQYAVRPGPTQDTYYCSSAPNVLVNSQGLPIN